MKQFIGQESCSPFQGLRPDTCSCRDTRNGPRDPAAQFLAAGFRGVSEKRIGATQAATSAQSSCVSSCAARGMLSRFSAAIIVATVHKIKWRHPAPHLRAA